MRFNQGVPATGSLSHWPAWVVSGIRPLSALVHQGNDDAEAAPDGRPDGGEQHTDRGHRQKNHDHMHEQYMQGEAIDGVNIQAFTRPGPRRR